MNRRPQHNLSFEDIVDGNLDKKILIENYLERKDDKSMEEEMEMNDNNKQEIEGLIKGISFSGEGLSGPSDDEGDDQRHLYNYTDEDGIEITYGDEEYHEEWEVNEKSWEEEDDANFHQNYEGFFGDKNNHTQNFSREDETEMMDFPQVTAPSVELSKNNSFRETGMKRRLKSPAGINKNGYNRNNQNAFDHLVEKDYGREEEEENSKDDRHTVVYHDSQIQNDSENEREPSMPYAEIYGLSLESSIKNGNASHFKEQDEQDEIEFLKDETYAKVIKAIEEGQNELLKKELEELIKHVYNMEIEKRNWIMHCEELKENIDLLKAESHEELDLLRGKMLDQAKMQIEQLKILLEQKDEEIGQLVHNFKYLDVENKSLKQAIQSDMKAIVEEIEKDKIIVEGYRQNELKISKDLEEKDNIIWNLNQKLNEMDEEIKQRDNIINEREFNLIEAKKRMEEMIKLLNQREEENSQIQMENRNLKDVIEMLKTGAEEGKLQEETKKVENISNEERMKYEYEIQELRRKIMVMDKGNNQEKRNVFLDLVDENFGERPFNDQKTVQTVDNEFNQINQESQCKIIESMFGEWLSLLLLENSLIENCDEMDLGELQHNVRMALKNYVGQVSEMLVTQTDRNNIEKEITEKVQNLYFDKIKELEEFNEKKERMIEELREEIETLEGKYQSLHKKSVEDLSTLRDDLKRSRIENEKISEDLQRNILILEEFEKSKENDFLEQSEERKETPSVRKVISVSRGFQTSIQIPDELKISVEMRETSAMTEFSNPTSIGIQVTTLSDEMEIMKMKNRSKIEELNEKIKQSKKKIMEKSKVINDLKTKCKCLEDRINKVKEEATNMTERGTAQLSSRVKSLEGKLSHRTKDLRGKDKKNVELFKQVKELKTEKKILTEKIEEFSEEISRLHQVYKKQLKETELSQREKNEESSKKSQVVQGYIDEAIFVKQELQKVKIEMEEMYEKLDQIYVEKNILYETLNKQLNRNKIIGKENEFLRLTLDNINNAPQSIELELLSFEETENLLKVVLSKASKSRSLQRSIKASEEFRELCRKLDEDDMESIHHKILAYEKMNIDEMDDGQVKRGERRKRGSFFSGKFG